MGKEIWTGHGGEKKDTFGVSEADNIILFIDERKKNLQGFINRFFATRKVNS